VLWADRNAESEAPLDGSRSRKEQPKTLIFWGRGDIFFAPEGGEAYLRDLPDARLESGHFAVEDCLDEIAGGTKEFYDTNVR
jgi:pimeloyl-ACP methyl ester carboxylesterase